MERSLTFLSLSLRRLLGQGDGLSGQHGGEGVPLFLCGAEPPLGGPHGTAQGQAHVWRHTAKLKVSPTVQALNAELAFLWSKFHAKALNYAELAFSPVCHLC